MKYRVEYRQQVGHEVSGVELMEVDITPHIDPTATDPSAENRRVHETVQAALDARGIIVCRFSVRSPEWWTLIERLGRRHAPAP